MLHVLRRDRIGTPAALLTSMNEDADRVAMHGVRAEVLRAQAEAAGLPLITIPLPSPCSNELYEQRMRDAVERAVADGFTHVAFGDLFLEDVRRYREERLAGTGLTPIFPLWRHPTADLAREMLSGGLRAHLTCVDRRVLAPAFAGRSFDESLLGELPPGIDPCGERGEFHSCVVDGPMFARPVDVTPGAVVERGDFVFADLLMRKTGAAGQAANSTGTR
jgi:uncharacterized protein (TIGR00290 family)